MKTFYAIANGQSITEDIYEGGFLRYEKNSEPYSDLHRFNSKKERDNFVEDSDSHSAITLSEIKKDKHYSEQYKYFN